MFHEPGSPHELADDSPNEDADATTALPDPEEGLRGGFRRAFGDGNWKIPLALFLVALAVYGLFAFDRVLSHSRHTHFVYLAKTMNSMVAAPFSPEAAEKREGEVPFELNRDPPHNNDWASWWELHLDAGDQYRGVWLGDQGEGQFLTLQGEVFYIERGQIRERKRRYFVSFPPMPAVMMMPLAAVWDYEVNDVQFTLLFAALNVMLMFLVLRRLSRGGRSGRSRRDNLWLTLLFGLGTAHLWCSVLGQVWFTALVLGVFFALLYVYFAVDARHPFLAGLALACGFATRTPLVFASIFFFAFVFFPDGTWRDGDWGEAFEKLAWFCLPCLVIGGALLWMNWVRFGSPVEFGHRYLAGGTIQRIKRYGLFNFHFLSKNLSAMLTLLPRLQPEWPYIIVSEHGMSIFATTPAFFYLFMPEERESDRDQFWWRLLWITVAVVGLPALFYQNTGREQFGYRFVMDYMPFLICLLAVGRHRITRVFKACIVAAIMVNAFGAVTFKRIGQFYKSGFFL